MFDVTRYATAAQSIVEAGRFLYDRGWAPATSSNYSARIDGDHVAITVSTLRTSPTYDGCVLNLVTKKDLYTVQTLFQLKNLFYLFYNHLNS